MKTYLIKPGIRQAIAKAGETDVAVAFDGRAWKTEYPAGRPQLLVTAPGGRQTPVTVTEEDGMIEGQVPAELLSAPGAYVYQFVWTQGTTQQASNVCDVIILASQLADTWANRRHTPEWAERIFQAAEVIEGAMDGALEARHTALSAAESAAESRDAAAASAERAAEDAENAAEDAQAAAAKLAEVNEAGAAQTAAIQLKGETTLASIPPDYTALDNEVDDLKSAFEELGDSVFAEIGEDIEITRSRFIEKTTGINTSNSKRARTGLLDGHKSSVAVGMSNPIYDFFVSYYYENGDISDGTGYIESSETVAGGSELIYIPSDAKKIVVSFSRVDRAVLTVDDTTAIQAALSLYTLTDKTLTILGAPADAKVVGEKLTVLERGEKTYTLTPGFTDGVYVYKDNTLVTNSTYSVSDYVDVKPYSKIIMNWYLPSDSAYMVFLDESRENVVAFYNRSTTPAYGSGEKTIPIPEGAAWFRTSQRTDNLSSFSLSGTFPYIEKTKELLSATEPVEELPCSTIIRDGGFCKIFKTIGVVGDSLSSGSMHPPESGPSTGGEDEIVVDKIWYSWIQQMARYTGSTAINFSVGGLGARSLRFSTAAGATQIRANLQNSENMCNAYFIAMGHNDKTYMDNHSEYTIGSNADIDPSDKDNNPDTYCGNIGWIISAIKQVAPGAKIFIITMKAKSAFGALNDALRTIPEVFNTDENRTVYLLDMETYAPKIESSWEYLNGHGSPQGYLNYSWQISSYVDWYIRHYQNEFKLTAFFQ